MFADCCKNQVETASAFIRPFGEGFRSFAEEFFGSAPVDKKLLCDGPEMPMVRSFEDSILDQLHTSFDGFFFIDDMDGFFKRDPSLSPLI